MTKNTLKTLRESCSLPKTAVAKHLKISRPTYLQIEKGNRELTISQAKSIAELFNVPLQTIIEEHPAPKYEVFLEDPRNLPKPKKSKETIRISVPQNKVKLFKEILLYILEKVGSKANVGETVIYKLLYFIDFDYYEKFEEQLIGAKYIKNHHGPTPVAFKKIVEQMQGKGEIEPVKSKFFQYDQKKYLPLRKPDLNTISARDIKHIDEILDKLGDKTAKELSDYSHKDVPWITAEDGKPIEYEAVFYRNDNTATKDHEMEFLEAGMIDVAKEIPPLTKKEYDYYMSLPDKK